MMKSITLLAAVLLMIMSCGDSTGPEEGPGGESTYTVDGYEFTWQQDPDSDQHLLFTVEAPTTGWVAVGFAPTAFMADANLILGYIDQTVGFIRDDFGTGQFTHAADLSLGGTSDVELMGGSESGGVTTVSFRIPYDSGDQYDRVLVEGETYTFIFAYGTDGADDFTSAHAWAETASFEL
jgi:hypothetical protein